MGVWLPRGTGLLPCSTDRFLCASSMDSGLSVGGVMGLQCLGVVAVLSEQHLRLQAPSVPLQRRSDGHGNGHAGVASTARIMADTARPDDRRMYPHRFASDSPHPRHPCRGSAHPVPAATTTLSLRNGYPAAQSRPRYRRALAATAHVRV